LIYLDYHSATPLDPRVLEAMAPYYFEHFGNSSSLHDMGENARRVVEESAEKVGQVIGASKEDIYFCSGATEANNIILKGMWLNKLQQKIKSRRYIVTVATEHASILKCTEAIYNYDSDTDGVYVSVDKNGKIDFDDLEGVLDSFSDRILVVSVMLANNEIGTIQDIARIGAMCRARDLIFHTDAAQALDKVNIDVVGMCIDALSLSSHKIYGPKGVGALYLNERAKHARMVPFIDGGYQGVYTSGTQNIPGIVGMAKACEIRSDKAELERIAILRDRLLSNLQSKIDDIIINGPEKDRLPNNLNISIPDVPSEALIIGLGDEVMFSGASACSSGGFEESHVLQAIGAEYPGCAFRFGLGRWTTTQEIDDASEKIIEQVKNYRGM